MIDKPIGIDGMVWFKSSYSGEDVNKTDCVEAGRKPGSSITFVRDSSAPKGGTFRVSPEAWNGLLDSVRRDVS